jgi:hypothetical protein
LPEIVQRSPFSFDFNDPISLIAAFPLYLIKQKNLAMKKSILTLAALGVACMIQAQTPAQPPNAGMETWGSALNEPKEPTGWVSENALASPVLTFPNPNPNPTSVTQDNTAPAPFAGLYSAKITTVVVTTNPGYPTIPDTVGYLILGSVKTSPPYLIPGAPYTSKPLTFTFESMYTPVGGDAAGVSVQLSKWDATTTPPSRIVIATAVSVIAPSSVFTLNSLNLTYLNQTAVPDTLQLSFSSSATRSGARPGSELVLDGLAFTGINGIQEYKNAVSFNAYPNPASSEINLVTSSKEVSLVNVYDITGRELEALKITSDHTVLNTASYTTGIYFYSATNSKGEILARGKFNVVK